MTPTSLFRRHVTLTGRVLTFRTPSPPMAAFLARLEAAVTDPTISEDDFVAIFHGPDNPLLRHDIVAGRSLVTAEAFADPLYHVMNDLLGCKRVALGRLDLARAEARHTLTVAETAARLGLDAEAVARAISRFELSAWKKGEAWFLDPDSVEAYRVYRETQVRPGVLDLRIGACKGYSLQVANYSTAHLQRSDGAWEGSVELRPERCISVLWKRGDHARYFLIKGGGSHLEEIANKDLFVRGYFTKESVVNDAVRARRTFHSLTRRGS